MPYVYGMSISAATKKLEQAGFTVDKQYVYSNKVPQIRLHRLVTESGLDRRPSSATIYATYSRVVTPPS